LSAPPREQLKEFRMKIDGACHCGKITYEAEVDPERARMPLH
jgi:hypothetical protein